MSKLNIANNAEMEGYNHITHLYSYGLMVATYDHYNNKLSMFGWHSQTTQRHQNMFAEFFGFDPMTKEEITNYKN